jgi:hypothetical protein
MDRSVARLPIIWHRRNLDTAGQASQAMQVAAKVLRAIDDIFSFALVVSAKGGALTEAWFEVDGFGRERTLDLARRIAIIVTKHATWMGLGAIEWAPSPTAEPFAFEIVPTSGLVLQTHHTWSPAWEAAAALDGEFQLRANLIDVLVPLDADPSALMSITVTGTSSDTEVVAISYAQELSTERNFRARPVAHNTIPSRIDMSMHECGRALSTPSRITGRTAWADAPLRPFDEVMAQLCSTTGAVSIFGGSGNGKSTLMLHMGDRLLDAGETIVLICPHGELSAPFATLALQRGVRFDSIWFGDPVAPPAFNLTQSPHPSIPLGDWLEQVPEIVLSTHRTLGLTYEMAGPVWYSNFSAALEVIAHSGVGTILDSAPLIADAELSAELKEAIDNLSDPNLKRRIKEARKAVIRSTDGSYAVFQNSKLHFLQAPRMRAIFGRQYNSFSLEPLFDEGRSLFVSASVAELGEHGAAVVTTALLTAIYEVARRRNAADRRRIRLMIPEAHLVNPTLLRTLLAEGRKFGITGTVMDLQTPTTLQPDTRAGLLGNSGAIASFRLGPADATLLDGRYPTIPATRIQQLPPYRMALTLGDNDALVDTRPAPCDVEDDSAFVEAHRRTQSHPKPRKRRRPPTPKPLEPSGGEDPAIERELNDETRQRLRSLLVISDD